MKNDFSLLILTKYDRSGPSSRYRILQFIPYLESHGFRCTVQSLHTADYLETIYSGRAKSPLYYLGRLLARAQAVARASHYSAVFVQKEIAPYLPPWFELMLSAMRAKVVYDIDDAIYVPYSAPKRPAVRLLLGSKIPAALRRSTVVLAGNPFLREYASRYNRQAVYFPTVIDPARYTASRSGGSVPVIGWIGSPGTVRFLEERADVLRDVALMSPFELRVIGVPALAIPGLDVKFVPWSEETEARELSACDVGIMPLPEDDWTKGKCGLKLLQYMACGLPVVSSPDGSAGSIVEHGVNGYIARSGEEWRLYLGALLDNEERRRLMGRAGRRRVEEHFSLEAWAPRMAEILLKCMRGERVEDAAS
jgi:glycosyltransferase involved in cell wall biosynthesis